MSEAIRDVKLTQTTKKGGCAAKLPAGELKEFLSKLHFHRPTQLVVGTENLDDAALWDLENGQYLIQTLDFFTPIVDDAEDFGAIAAANAISDIYAMGGRPITALSILAFPSSHLPMELIQPLMGGALSKINEAGAALAGGHSIDDETLKLGFSVSGLVDKSLAWMNRGSKVGDLLILTKALGTGTITSAAKKQSYQTEHLRKAIESMKTLNRVPELIVGARVNAATDITGFGLAGHALQMAIASNVSFEIQLNQVPAIEGAKDYIELGVLNRAHHTNRSYALPSIQFDKSVSSVEQWLSFDPQTSGGLLLSVDTNDAGAVLEKIKGRFPQATLIGQVIPKQDSAVLFNSVSQN